MTRRQNPDDSHSQLPIIVPFETPGRGFQADGNNPWNEPPSRQEIEQAWSGLSPEEAEELRRTGLAGAASARAILETVTTKSVVITDEHSTEKPQVTKLASTLRRKNALARALTPEYLGLKPEDYDDITPHMVELAAPEHLRSSLIGVSRSAPEGTTVSYWSRETGTILIAVTPQEHGVMNRYVRGLGDRAAGRTRHSRQAAGAPLSPADRGFVERSGVHAVESRTQEKEKYLRNALEPNLQLIARFKEAAQHPDFARFKDEGDMRKSLAYLRTTTFGDMISTIGEQRQWTPDQAQLAQRAIEKRLFLVRSRNQHIKMSGSLYTEHTPEVN